MSLDINAALYGTLRRMHSVQRYSSLPLVRHENVAEHSWQVAMLSWLIATDMVHERGVDLMMEEVLAKAITHDLSECLSGDIIRSYGHSSQQIKDAIAAANAINMTKLCEEVSGGPGHDRWHDKLATNLYDYWVEAKNDFEGAIVAFADMLTVVSYCQQERALGSRKVDHVLEDLYRNVMHRYHEDEAFAPYMREIFPNREWHDPFHQRHLAIRVDQPEAT